MQECVGITLQLAAIILSEELDYGRAAKKLNIRPAELKLHIVELEELLQFQIFATEQGAVIVTKAGQVFLNACRQFVALNRRKSCDPGYQ